MLFDFLFFLKKKDFENNWIHGIDIDWCKAFVSMDLRLVPMSRRKTLIANTTKAIVRLLVVCQHI